MSTSRTGKGQASLEFMATVVLLMLVFAGVYEGVAAQQVRTAETQVQLQAASTADRIGYELDLALAEGDGFYRTIQLPSTIGGADYNVSVANGTVRLDWYRSTVFSTTAVPAVIGEIGPGMNTIRNNGSLVVDR